MIKEKKRVNPSHLTSYDFLKGTTGVNKFLKLGQSFEKLVK
jgi:hypothetical protein